MSVAIVELIVLPKQKHYHPGEIHSCNLLIQDSNGNPIPGQKPTIVIYRTNDNKYLDFASGKFVSSGGQKYQILTEIRPGVYAWNFNQDKYDGPNRERTYKIVYENKGKYPGTAVQEVVYKWTKRNGVTPEPVGSEGIYEESQID